MNLAAFNQANAPGANCRPRSTISLSQFIPSPKGTYALSAVRNNLRMVDVPVYVAIITAGAGIIGAAIPQVTTVIRDVRRAERDRRERFDAATREACVALLRASGQVRTLTESIHTYRGEANGMRERVEEVRSRAETTRVHAAEVSMLVPARLAEPADRVASAASDLADDVMRNTDLNHGVLVGDPDVSKLVECIATFRSAAVDYAAQ